MRRAASVAILFIVGVIVVGLLRKPRNGVDVIGGNGDDDEPLKDTTNYQPVGITDIMYNSEYDEYYGCQKLATESGNTLYRVVKKTEQNGGWSPLMGSGDTVASSTNAYTYASKVECVAEVTRLANRTRPPTLAPPQTKPPLTRPQGGFAGLTGHSDLTDWGNLSSTGGWGG